MPSILPKQIDISGEAFPDNEALLFLGRFRIRH